MATVEAHYQDVLSGVYSWMLGGFDVQIAKNRSFFENHHIQPKGSGVAVDLGAGCGFQSIPLAEIGYSVTAIDLDDNLLIAPTVMRFRKADTPFFDFRKPATTLITDGPYRYSRNPGYLALTLLYLGLGVLISSAWVCVLVVPTLLIMNVAVVRKEEQHLESQFGEEYLRYKTAVRRWL